MKVCKNNLMRQFYHSDVQLDGIFRLRVTPGAYVRSTKTSENVNGIIVPLSGRARYEIESESYRLEAGVVLFSGGGLPLNKYVIGDDAWEYLLIHYRAVHATKRELLVDKKHFTLTIGDVERADLLKLCNQMIRHQKRSDLLSQLKNKTLLWKLFESLFQHGFENCFATDREKIDFVVDYISEHFDKDLSITELAEVVDLEPHKFSHAFTKSIGMRPKRYITQMKIHHAKELLLKTSLSIHDIALKIGYDDPLYFSRIFKKETGAAPSVYRQQVEKSPYGL